MDLGMRSGLYGTEVLTQCPAGSPNNLSSCLLAWQVLRSSLDESQASETSFIFRAAEMRRNNKGSGAILVSNWSY